MSACFTSAMNQAQAGSKPVDNQAEPSNAPALKKTFEQVHSKRASAAQPSQLQLADPPAEEEVDSAEKRDAETPEAATDSSGPFAWNVWMQAPPITPEPSLEAGVNAASSFPETATPAATEQATHPTPSEISQFSPAASQGKDVQGAKLVELVTPSSQSPTREPAKAASTPVTEAQAEKASSAKDVQIVTAPAQPSDPGQEPADGTGSAKSALQMHNAAETGQSAKQLVQPLPGKPAKAASFDPVSESTASARYQSWTLANSVESVTVTSASTPDVEASSPTRVVHQAELEIRTQAVSMKQLQSDAMSVVLKPDGQTELHLQLRMQDNQVHVLAECKRGDVSALHAHWGELQKNLSQQGIRLAPLQESFSSSFSQSGASSGQFQSMEQQPRERQQFPAPETPRPVSPRQSTHPKSSAPQRPNRLWESWA